MTETETLPDAPLLRHTADIQPRPLPAALHQARAELAPLVAAILALPEASLAQPWPWIGGSEEEVRYGAYLAGERLERAEVEAARALQVAGHDGGPAAAIVGAATTARWDLQGILAGLTDDDLDADPGGGEWTIRSTMGHVINGQRAYAWGTARFQELGRPVGDPAVAAVFDEPFWEALPEEDKEECAGSLADIRSRLDAILDLAAERLAGMPAERLDHGARWSGFSIPVRHRMGRWSSHLREHTIQIDKTLVMLARTPTEPQRLARLVLAAYGRAEQVVFGQSGAVVDECALRIRDAVVQARDELASAARSAG